MHAIYLFVNYIYDYVWSYVSYIINPDLDEFGTYMHWILQKSDIEL